MAQIGHSPRSGRSRPKRSDVGIELVRTLSAEGVRIFTPERAREFSRQLGIKDAYLIEALYHLRQTNWIMALRRGLYAISPSVPGVNPAHEFEIAMALVQPAAISHWSALHHHGLTDQAPRRTFVLTTTDVTVPRDRTSPSAKRKSPRMIGGGAYQFVQVKPERFFGIEKAWVGDAPIMITDPERTLLDGLSMPHYCGDFGEVLHAFQVRSSQLNLSRIIDYARRSDAALAKRLGWVLQRQGVAPEQLRPLLSIPIKGFRKLDPTGPREGPYDKEWSIQENLPGHVDR